MKKEKLDIIDKEIIRILYNAGIPLTISEVSKETGISWNTIKKHTDCLKDMGVIDLIETQTRKMPKIMLDLSFIQRLIAPQPSI